MSANHCRILELLITKCLYGCRDEKCTKTDQQGRVIIYCGITRSFLYTADSRFLVTAVLTSVRLIMFTWYVGIFCTTAGIPFKAQLIENFTCHASHGAGPQEQTTKAFGLESSLSSPFLKCPSPFAPRTLEAFTKFLFSLFVVRFTC